MTHLSMKVSVCENAAFDILISICFDLNEAAYFKAERGKTKNIQWNIISTMPPKNAQGGHGIFSYTPY